MMHTKRTTQHMNTNEINRAATDIAAQLVGNIGRAAEVSRNYPSAWLLWKTWADELVPEEHWRTPGGAEFLRQVKRNLQNMTAMHLV